MKGKRLKGKEYKGSLIFEGEYKNGEMWNGKIPISMNVPFLIFVFQNILYNIMAHLLNKMF